MMVTVRVADCGGEGAAEPHPLGAQGLGPGAGVSARFIRELAPRSVTPTRQIEHLFACHFIFAHVYGVEGPAMS